MFNPWSQDTTNQLLKTVKELREENETMPFESIINQNLQVIESIREVLESRGVTI